VSIAGPPFPTPLYFRTKVKIFARSISGHWSGQAADAGWGAAHCGQHRQVAGVAEAAAVL